MINDHCTTFKSHRVCDDPAVSLETKTDVQFRQTAEDPAPAVLIGLQQSAYDRKLVARRVLLWIGIGTAINVIVGAITSQLPSATFLVPLLFVVALAVYLLARFAATTALKLKLIDRTLHKLDERGEVVESIADLRGEVQPVVWGFSHRGEPYSGRALVLRFASGPLVVGLYPAPGALEGTRSEAPSWMISQEDYDLLVRAAQFDRAASDR